jgi:hypothetical protein
MRKLLPQMFIIYKPIHLQGVTTIRGYMEGALGEKNIFLEFLTK